MNSNSAINPINKKVNPVHFNKRKKKNKNTGITLITIVKNDNLLESVFSYYENQDFPKKR